VTFVLRMMCLEPSNRSRNMYTSTQCVLVSASQRSRPLGGEYPIGDSWQPLISSSNSKKCERNHHPTNPFPANLDAWNLQMAAHNTSRRAAGSIFLTSPIDCFCPNINSISERWQHSCQVIARITVKSPPRRPTRDGASASLAMLAERASLGIRYPLIHL
jgi:hypothetical protein